MTFAQSVSYCMSNYVSASGRGGRSEYWWFILFTALAGLTGAVIDIAGDVRFVNPLVNLALLLPTICAASRRLHDTDRSGWWQLLILLPLIGALVLLYWMVREGTPGPNRYGAAPVAIE